MLILYRLNTYNLNRSFFRGDHVWKYLTVEKFEELLSYGIKFTVVEKWLAGDCFEGKYSELQFQLRDEDPLKKDYRNMTEEEISRFRLDLMKMQYQFGVIDGKLVKTRTTQELKERSSQYEKKAFASSFHVNEPVFFTFSI